MFNRIPHRLKTRAGRLGNKGMSLIEIMVVVAIIAIASSIVWISVNTVFGLEAKQCAKDLAGAVEKTKVGQMTKADASWVYLHREADGVYLDLYESGFKHDNEFEDGNRIGNSRVSVTYTLTDGAKTVNGTLDADGIVLAFNRSDGSFMTAGEARATARTVMGGGFTPQLPDGYYTAVTISSGGISRTITLYPNTGKLEYAL